ncbi:autophagy-related protein 2 homolog A [Pituophis catenifer annectens]|uniref:autophagy-related protein 2 homolog A n=1 Tax=Pituophis catenifer annectens TaxID=94852 RepID=UPI00399611B2
MSRWFFPWSSSIKKRACRYLLQHYLGHFLEERLGLEQLSLDLYAGAGRLTRLHLDVWSVNEFLESVGAPLEILDGFIDSIAVTIPWSALVTENCTVEVSGLQVTCRPKYRQGHAGSESQSWPSSMTTSMQLAQECLKEQTEEPSDASQPLEGLEMFAQTIETVLRRIEVTFVDTVIRVEHTPRSGEAPGVALEIHIKRLDYCDEVVRDPGQAVAVDIHQPPPFVHKILQLSGLLLYYEEFGEGSARGPKEAEPCDSGGEEAGPSPLLQIGSCSGYTEMRIKLKQNEAFPGAKLELDGKIGSLHLLLAPRQILHLTDLLSSLNLSESGLLQEQLSKNRPLDSEDLKLIEQDLSQQLHSGLGSAPPHLEGMAAGVENGEMFFSMAPMTSSVASLRSVSDLSDLDSSVHSDISTAPLQPPAFAPGLSLGSPRRYRRLPFASTLPGLNKIPRTLPLFFPRPPPAVVEDYLTAEHLEIPNFLPPDELHPTIYASQEGPISWPLGAKKDGPSKMMSVAIQINLDMEKNIKEFLVTLRLEGATIRHRMALAHQSWYTQLIDFLDVLDDPILGFVPPAIITVLHTHLFNCAVDYRPLYLPLRVLITAETFTLSSNIIVDTSVFLLRFILDNSTLFLSNKCEAETGDLNKDYVCVVEVDLLELVITTWKGATTGKLTRPLFELRCSNNVVHIHTCADSCAALANLIQYVVNKGDQHPPPRHDSPTEIAGQKVQLSESPASLPTCPPAETAAINQRDLTDALMDTERGYQEMTGDSGMRRQPSPVSVYLFPGENGAAGQGKAPPPPGTPVAEGLDFSPSEDSEGESEATDGFCILDAPGTGIPPRDGEPVVTKLLEGPVHIQEGHFSRPLGSTDLLKAPSHFPVPESRVVMREISVVWHLYGGRDFGPGRSPSGHMHSPRTKSSLPSTRSSPSRSSVSSRPQSSWRAQGGPGRIHDLLMEIQLTKVSFQHESYSTGASEKPSLESEEQPLARQVFVVQELEIRDRLASSQINKFLYLYSSELLPRRAHSNMLTIKALHVCPEAGVGGPECCLRVSLMPLRLNIDQDALFFLKDFFTSVAASINPVVPMEAGSEGRVESPGKDSEAAERMMATSVETTTSENSSNASSSSEQPIYFREFRFTSEVPIWLDYHGKHVTVDQVGTFAGILIGLAQLNCSELKLKRLCCRHGLLGVEKVVSYALTEWLTDIRKNQLPGILGGVGPMHSFVQLFHGLRDLFWLPIEQYRKDGRIIRGLQRGAASFGTSTASAALELSNRLVQAIQATAETVYDILSPTAPPSRALPDRKYARKLRRGHQPADLREGVAKAYDTVREGVIDTAQAICDVAARGHEQKGITGAVGGVLRQIPPTVVKPLIVASEATSNLLGGMRNQIKPDALKEESLKWRLEESQD